MKKATSSQLAAALLELKGKPINFTDYKPFTAIYDIDPDIMVFKAGRQIGKSVSLGGRLVSKSIGRPYFNSLYIAPFQIQAKRFSNAYLDAFLESPLVKKYFRRSNDPSNVFEKTLANKSKIYLSYAQTESDADRIRGLMADLLTVDEVQDVSYDALPPIFEILNASEYALKVLAGTSKSTANTLEQLWLRTNRLEWANKCPHCGHWVIPDTYEKCVRICQPHGPSCDKCLKPIDPGLGQWIATNPLIQDKVGFHLPQIIIGDNCKPKKWARLIDKVKQAQEGGLYTPATLANEVFGLATDLSGRSLSMAEAMKCCNEQWKSWASPTDFSDPVWAAISKTIVRTVLGVDWSVTGGVKSYTVATVLGYDGYGRCYMLESKKMQGIHILDQVRDVCLLARKWNCAIIGSDRGVGVLQGQLMQQELGHDKVIMVNYVAAKQRLRWDQQGQFLAADRSQAIDNVMMKWRIGPERFMCPAWAITEGFWTDALNVFEEETGVGRRVYRHHPDEPDDWMHSVVFAHVAYQYLEGDFKYTE